MDDPRDWELVARAQAGDAAAFTVLVRRYEVPVRRFCGRMVRSAEDAEDLAQETFVRLHRHLHTLHPRAKFSTAILGIARNLTLNHLRNDRRRGRDSAAALDGAPQADGRSPAPDSAAQQRELGAIIEQALGMLNAQQREIVVLRDIEGFDYGEIATLLGCRRGTVKSRLARAREQLRRHILELGGELA
jgi:RNA polymerase sigma-70 factor (ECF subfamily)